MARLTGTDIGETLIGTPGRDRIFGLGGDDELRGGAGKDILDGGLGRDYVLGEDGNDVINGGSSGPFYTGEDDDVLDGGNGQDWVTYEDLDATLFLKFDEGRTLYTHKDQLLNIENAIGSKRDAHFWGDNSDNTFVGIGRMTEFFSSAGDDKYLNKGDRATLYYGGDPAGIILNAGKGVALDGFGDEDRFKRIDFIAGSDFDDVMLGSKRADSFNSAAGDDELNGSGGNDNLIAGPGDDELSGGKGNDNLGGGPGNDTINGGAGRDSILLDESQLVDLSAGFASGSGDVDTISSIENISLAGSNIAIGNDAINTFYSANGNSVMTGGGGADHFQFVGGLTNGADRITDFEIGADTIEVPTTIAEIIHGPEPEHEPLPTGPISTEMFVIGTAEDSDDFFIFDPIDEALSFDADGADPVFGPVTFVTFGSDVELRPNDIVVVGRDTQTTSMSTDDALLTDDNVFTSSAEAQPSTVDMFFA